MAFAELTAFDHRRTAPYTANASGTKTTSTTVNRRTGGSSLDISTTTSVAAWLFAPAGVGGLIADTASMGVYVYFPVALPGALTQLCSMTVTGLNGDFSFAISYSPSTGRVEGRYDNGTIITSLGAIGPTIATGTWYRLYLSEAGANLTVGIATGDGALATASLAHADVGTGGQWLSYLGWQIAAIAHVNYTDWIFGDNASDVPSANGWTVRGYSPSAVGTHSLDANPSAYFFNRVATTDTALTPSETTSYQSIDDVPLENDDDRVKLQSAFSARPTIPTNGVGAYTSGAAGVTPALPTGAANGDLLLLFVEAANQPLSSGAITGWTLWNGAGVGTAAGTTATSVQVFYRTMATGVAAPSVPDAGDHVGAFIMAIRGAGTALNTSVTNTDATAVAGATFSIPALTAPLPNCMYVAAYTDVTDAATAGRFAPAAGTGLANVVERQDIGTIAGNGGGLGVFTADAPAAGSTGASSVVYTNASAKAAVALMIPPVETAPAATIYTEYQFADEATITSAPLAAAARVVTKLGSSILSYYRIGITDSTGEVSTPLSTLSTAPFWLRFPLTFSTVAAVNASVLRFRPSANSPTSQTPVGGVFLESAMLEVLYAVSAGGPTTISKSGGFASALTAGASRVFQAAKSAGAFSPSRVGAPTATALLIISKTGGAFSAGLLGGTKTVLTLVVRTGGFFSPGTLGGARTYRFARTGGSFSPGTLGAARTVIQARSGGSFSAGTLGGARTFRIARTGGHFSAGLLGGTKALVTITAKIGGFFSAGTLGAPRAYILGKTGGSFSTGTLGASRTTRYARSAGFFSAATLGGARASITARSGGFFSPSLLGGTWTKQIARTGGVFSAGTLGGSKVAGTFKVGGPISVSTLGASRTTRAAKSAGPLSVSTLGGARISTLAKTGGWFAAGTLGGARAYRFARTGGPLSAGLLGGAKFQSQTTTKTGGFFSSSLVGGAKFVSSAISRTGGFFSPSRIGSATATRVITRSGGPFSAGTLGASRTFRSARVGGTLSLSSLGAVGAYRVARTGGIFAPGTLGGAQFSGRIFTKTGGIFSSGRLGGTQTKLVIRAAGVFSPVRLGAVEKLITAKTGGISTAGLLGATSSVRFTVTGGFISQGRLSFARNVFARLAGFRTQGRVGAVSTSRFPIPTNIQGMLMSAGTVGIATVVSARVPKAELVGASEERAEILSAKSEGSEILSSENPPPQLTGAKLNAGT